jgi:integrase
MSKRRSSRSKSVPTTPKVRIVRPSGRPYQLRYHCPKLNKEIRISVSSRDEQETQRQKANLEAKLLLGINPQAESNLVLGPNMPWEEFRQQYRLLHLDTLRDNSVESAEIRLDVAEKILKPKTLADMADSNALHKLQARVHKGECSKLGRGRSPRTVKSYMAAVIAALNWARLLGWIDETPEIRKIKVSKHKQMKGRPITADEFQQMIDVTPLVVGDQAAPSWLFALQGFWESALRLDELMHVSWDQPEYIRPIWDKGVMPTLDFPAEMQKNNTHQRTPLLPDFETLLLKTPPEQRSGWVFNPASLQTRMGRKSRQKRLSSEWVGKIITRIGEQANVVVEPGKEKLGKPPKYASAHDLRRSCGERLREAGVPPLVITGILRHSSWETTQKHYAPGNVQRDAELLRSVLDGAN